MRRISERRLSQLGGRVPSSTITGTRKPIRKKPRKPSEFARIYGSKARVEWVKSQRCVACWVVSYSENAHIENGGTGRKADYTKIVPLCGRSRLIFSCHAWLHQYGRDDLERSFGIDLDKLAAETQARWLAIADQSGRGPTTKGSPVK